MKVETLVIFIAISLVNSLSAVPTTPVVLSKYKPPYFSTHFQVLIVLSLGSLAAYSILRRIVATSFS